MLKKQRHKYARKIRSLVQKGATRKQALYQVSQDLKQADLPASRRTLYRWLREFKIKFR